MAPLQRWTSTRSQLDAVAARLGVISIQQKRGCISLICRKGYDHWKDANDPSICSPEQILRATICLTPLWCLSSHSTKTFLSELLCLRARTDDLKGIESRPRDCVLSYLHSRHARIEICSPRLEVDHPISDPIFHPSFANHAILTPSVLGQRFTPIEDSE